MLAGWRVQDAMGRYLVEMWIAVVDRPGGDLGGTTFTIPGGRRGVVRGRQTSAGARP